MLPHLDVAQNVGLPAQLSDGRWQRVAFARVLVHRPRLLLVTHSKTAAARAQRVLHLAAQGLQASASTLGS